jgi:hypothetical protein
MILYHGSNQNFDKIDLTKSKDNRDFGKGFYTTVFKEQAESWAQVLFDRNGGEGLFLYEFAFDFTADLQIKKFDGVSEEWFDFILQNRTLGGTPHSFDIVQGPVANDKTTRTISNFIEGVYTRSEAMRRLAYNKLNDQISFHTEKAAEQLQLKKKNRIVTDRLTFQGQDLTFDIECKIEHIVSVLSETQHRSFDDVYCDFVQSQIYGKLQNTASMLWAESVPFIVDEYLREQL